MKLCLFIDDSDVIRMVATRILSEEFQVAEAGNGEEALRLCKEKMPHVIIVDGLLPDINAAELIQGLCQIETTMRPRIAVCLTEVDVGAIMRAKRAGADGYLLKPFHREQLLEKVRYLASLD